MNREYGIYAKVYYFAGTLHAPRGGQVQDCYGDPLVFNGRSAAVAHLIEYGNTPIGGGVWGPRGTYVLSHGEYAAPTYRIRALPVRTSAHREEDARCG